MMLAEDTCEWKDVIHSLPQPLVILDVAEKISFVNEAWLTFSSSNGFKTSLEDVLGKSYFDVLARIQSKNDPELLYRIQTGITKVIKGKKAQFSFEYALETKKAEHWFSLELTPLNNLKGLLLSHRDITERIKKEQEYNNLAYVDALTGLRNRNYFIHQAEDLLRIAQRNGHSLHLLFLDLDGFKQINDDLGHELGDALLRKIAKRFKTSMRESDLLARFGGDEFVALLEGTGDIQRAAERYAMVFDRPFRLAGQDKWLDVSIGIASFPKDGRNLKALLRKADKAMYLNKDVKLGLRPKKNTPLTVQRGIEH